MTAILGIAEGTDTFTAATDLSATGRVATFQGTAEKPSSIRIARDAPIPAATSDHFAVGLLQAPVFCALGFDRIGALIGPVKSD